MPYRAFDMVPARKRKRKRIAVAAGVTAAVLVVAVALGLFLYMNNLNSLLGLGDQGEEVESALSVADEQGPHYVLLVASDSREGRESSDYKRTGHTLDETDGNSDVIILARIDEEQDLLTLLTIPRDTPWQYESGEWNKLNSVYNRERIPGIINAVSQVTGLPIEHYVEIHMSQFIELVDLLGGITVDVPQTIKYREALTNEKVTIEAGEQHLDGVEAEVFARERLSYDGNQDMKRQSKVRVIIQAMIDQIKEKPLWELPSVVEACAACVSTDLSIDEIGGLVNALGSDFTIYSGSAPYDGDLNPNASDMWLCYVNPDGWQRVLDVFTSGGDPSTVSYEDDEVFVAGEEE